MAKLAWVLLPMLLVAAALLWRSPPRPRANAVLSLLLLAYVGTTAGLGLFWVANQQLPAFDWHYLFGYATLALLAVHLVFNLPAAWRLLRRRRMPAATAGRGQEPSLARPAGAPRRPIVLASGAIAAAAGVGYAIGLRHGRVELHVGKAPAAPGHPDAAEALALVRAFHALSSHSRTSVLRHAGTSGWTESPPPFKRYASAQRIDLPAAGRAIGPAPVAAGQPLLSEVLWHTAGVSLVRGGIHFRTAPSSGALFATELYVAAWPGGDLRDQWWHYDAAHHALVSIERPAATDRAAAFALPARADPALLVAVTAVFARSGHKYGDRTWRYVLADAGHAIENLLRVAAGLGCGAWLEPRFDDAALGAALGLDEQREGVLAVVQLVPGLSSTHTRGAAHSGSSTPAGERAAATLAWQAAPVQRGDGAADLTAAMQRASSLRAAAPVAPASAGGPAPPAPAGPRGTAAASQPLSAPPWRALPAARPLPADARGLIARRRSVRRYGARPLSLTEVATAVSAALGSDAVSAPALQLDLIAIRVEGLAAGAWSAAQAQGLTRRDAPPRNDWSASARAAALDQDVIGEAAAVLVWSFDPAGLAADPAAAARAYRHAFIEAGRAGERAYLAAGLLSLGCCSVGAFYDEELAALVGRDPRRYWAVHLVALGPPA